MATQILYNNIDPFYGIAGTPLVSYANQFIDYGERWGEVTHITLQGTITGYCGINGVPIDGGSITGANPSGIDGGGFTSGSLSGVDGGTFYPSDGNLFSTQQWLISNFNKDFQSLQIVENNQIIFNKAYCIVKGVNFSDSNYVKKLPFTIELDCYESGFFSGTFGVLEPKNEFNIIQEKDQSIRIEHTLSCRGFNTSSINSNALQNARNYIAQFSGFNNQVTPYFIQLCSGIIPSLVSNTENINRIDGSYSVTETYIAEKDYASGVLRYSATYNSGIADGLSNVRIAGSLKTAKNLSPSLLRARYSGFSAFGAAAICYSGATNGLIDLNPYYLSSGVTEDQFARSLNFDISFNNDQTPNPYIDYKIDFNQDDLTDVTSAKFQGTIKGRGELSQRWLAVQNYATGVDIFSLTFGEYVADGYQYFLNPLAISQSINKNPFIGEITLAATYNDKILPPTGLTYLDYSLSITPSIEKFSSTAILNGSGNFYVSDLGYSNRSIISINGNAVVDPAIPTQSGVAVLTSYINYLGYLYATGNRVVLERQDISQGNRNIGNDVTFSATWSFQDIIFNP